MEAICSLHIFHTFLTKWSRTTVTSFSVPNTAIEQHLPIPVHPGLLPSLPLYLSSAVPSDDRYFANWWIIFSIYEVLLPHDVEEIQE